MVAQPREAKIRGVAIIIVQDADSGGAASRTEPFSKNFMSASPNSCYFQMNVITILP